MATITKATAFHRSAEGHAVRSAVLRPVVLVGLTVAVVAALLTPAFTPAASAHHGSGDHQSTVLLYDTAWDLPTRGEPDDIIEYFDYLAAAGFDGVWLSFLPIDGWGLENTYGRDNRPASLNDNNHFVFHPDHVARVRKVLDEAHERGLTITMASAWGVAYIHGHWPDFACQNLDKGPLKATNARAYGQAIVEAIGDHPALERWLLGGDNFCNLEDVDIWTNMAGGIRASGSKLPIGYHTPSSEERHRRFSDQPWHQFFAAQTSHCNKPEHSGRELRKLVRKAKGKPVIAAELRYEAIEPEWEDCPIHGVGEPVLPQDVLDDVRNATEAGVSAIVYGHNDRWQWGQTTNGSNGDPMGSLDSPGERLMLQYLRNQGVLAGQAPQQASCNGLPATLIGTDGDDVLVGTKGPDVIVGLGGDDLLIGRGGNDVICGLSGSDKIKGGPGRDIVLGGSGPDTLLGNGGRDTLLGGGGIDSCNGGGSKDTGSNCESAKSIP